MSQRHNPFASIVRDAYRKRGLHQQDVAEAVGVSTQSMSQYLRGESRMPEAAFVGMCRFLSFDVEQQRRLTLARDLLHTPESVLEYLERLEAERADEDLCNQRLAKLQTVTADLLERRRQGGPWAPLLLAPPPAERPAKEGTSGIRRRVTPPPTDEDSGGFLP